MLRSLGRISDYRIDDRRERFLPLLVGAVCYVLCAITIATIPSAIFLRKFMVAAACCEVLCLVVSFYWKISLHLTGMGAVVALLVVMNVVGVGNMMVPLMAGGIMAGFVTSFITAAVELSATIMLVSRESQAPMSYGIYLYMQSVSGRGPGAALGVLAVLVVGLGTYFSHRFVERSRATVQSV